MGLIPSYENDIFISYAHNDNLDVFGVRWVEWFHKNLENLLIEKLGEKPVIWRDRRMDETDLVEGLLDSNISTSALMLAIVSPSYLKSKWCGWERKKFIECAERRGGLEINRKSRIIKVVKTQVDLASLPAEFQATLGSEFLHHDREANKYVQLPPQAVEYQQKLATLADSLKNLIEAFRTHVATAVPQAKEKTIYLAEAGLDLDAERTTLKSEFEQNGYHILPLVELPPKAVATEIEAKVSQYLESAQVSVHLLGKDYGFVPQRASGRSIGRIQYEMAHEQAADPTFKQVIWIPKGLENSEETEAEQKAFINELLDNSSALRRAEVLRSDIEELKTYVHNLLKPPTDSSVKFEGNGSVASVYLLCDKSDYEETQALEAYLTQQHYEVLPTLFDGETEEIAQYHRDSLLLCDAILAYYSQARHPWALMKKQEFIKLSGLDRPTPIAAKAFFISGEPNSNKDRFNSAEARVIKHYNGFSPASLTPFLDDILKAKGLL